MEGKPSPRERLDVPLVAPLERRLANLTRERPSIGPAPRSSVLDKLVSFLPQLAQENEKLQQQMQDRPVTDFDIEHVEEDGEAPYIEMDLTCGVLELRDDAALRAAERAMNGQEAIHASSSSDDDDEDSSDSDEDDSDDSDSDSEEEEEEEDSDVEAQAGALHDGGGGDGDRQGVGPGPRSGDPVTASDAAAEAAACTQPHDVMECDDLEGVVRPAQGGKAGRQPGRGRRRGPGRKGPGAAASGRGEGVSPGGRRKVAAKRSNFIEELS